MKDSLKDGIEHELKYTVPSTKIVSSLYPESPEFQMMPEVFATGFMVGLIEWACIQAVNPHIDWPFEQTVGTHINVSHLAPTPPGIEIRVKTKIVKVEGRKITFEVQARDEFDLISSGSHERFVINAERFRSKAREKLEQKSLMSSSQRLM